MSACDWFCQLLSYIASYVYNKTCSLCADANMHTDSHHTHRNECMHACNMLTKCTCVVSSMHICIYSQYVFHSYPNEQELKATRCIARRHSYLFGGEAMLEGVGIVTEQTAWCGVSMLVLSASYSPHTPRRKSTETQRSQWIEGTHMDIQFVTIILLTLIYLLPCLVSRLEY